MPELASRMRSTFRLPRVEFDLSGLLLGMAGYLAYQLSWAPIAGLLNIGGRMTEKIPGLGADGALKLEVFHALNNHLRLPGLGWITQQLGYAPLQAKSEKGVQLILELPSVELAPWEYGLVAVWFLLLWSLVGGALTRVHARRIARDESEGVFDALAFSGSSLGGFLAAPMFVIGAALFFGVLNALAGYVISLPWAGPVLQLVLHPLALIGGMVLTVVTLGGVFGLPVMHAALVTEKNGTLDAVSRTFSYVFTRPVLFLTGAAVVFVVSGVLLMCGNWFLDVTLRTLGTGAGFATFGDRPELTAGIQEAALRSGQVMGWAREFTLTIDGKAVQLRPAEFSTQLKLSYYVTWFFGLLGGLIVKGAVLSYVVGGLTDLYFMLRSDVDQVDDSEIFIEAEAASLGDPVTDSPN